LAWIGVETMASEAALTGGQKIEHTTLPSSHNDLHCAVLDDEVDIHLVQPYFACQTW